MCRLAAVCPCCFEVFSSSTLSVWVVLPALRSFSSYLPLYIVKLSGAAEKSYLLPTYLALRAASGRAKYVPATYLPRRAARPPAARNTMFATYLLKRLLPRKTPTYLPTYYLPAWLTHQQDTCRRCHPVQFACARGRHATRICYVAQGAFSFSIDVVVVYSDSLRVAITSKKFRVSSDPPLSRTRRTVLLRERGYRAA